MSGENHYLIAADGTIYPLRDLGVRLTGLSDIPVEYQTSRGYQQHGHTVQAWQLAPRTLTFAFAVDCRDRRRYETARQRLIDVLRPNQGTVTYRRVSPGGQRRDISGWLQTGLTLAESDDGQAFDASFSLICENPAFYDPASQAVTLTAVDISAFVLPFMVPDGLMFYSGALLSATINTAGTWRAYPTITITGPYTRLQLTNVTTGGYFTLGTAIAAGETVVVTLEPGQRAVTCNGVDALDEIEDGNLVNWYLPPGASQVQGSGSGLLGGTSSVTVSFNPRYIAI